MSDSGTVFVDDARAWPAQGPETAGESTVIAEGHPRPASNELTETPRPATHTLCANGCDFVTIQAALGDSTAGSGAVVEARDAEHTEAGIVISEGTEVTIRGLGAGETIVQAQEVLEKCPSGCS